MCSEEISNMNDSMDRKMIYLCLAHMSEEGFEQKYVKEAFDTNWVVPLGPNVRRIWKGLWGKIRKWWL